MGRREGTGFGGEGGTLSLCFFEDIVMSADRRGGGFGSGDKSLGIFTLPHRQGAANFARSFAV